MSRERDNLLSMCATLGQPGADLHQLSDLDLLRGICQHLDSMDQQLERLPDSLALPGADKTNVEKDYEFWNQLKSCNELLKQDHSGRRKMLLSRLDCTVESFKWKQQAADPQPASTTSGQWPMDLNDRIHEKYNQATFGITAEPKISLAHLLATRENEFDQLVNGVVSSQKTSDCYLPDIKDNSAGHVKLKQLIIPKVPDRGGRTDEMRAPPKENFSSQRYNRRR